MMRCEICQKQMKMLTNTHLKIHKINLIQYKERFPNSSTIDKELAKSFSKRSKKANEFRKGIPRSNDVKVRPSKMSVQRALISIKR